VKAVSRLSATVVASDGLRIRSPSCSVESTARAQAWMKRWRATLWCVVWVAGRLCLAGETPVANDESLTAEIAQLLVSGTPCRRLELRLAPGLTVSAQHALDLGNFKHLAPEAAKVLCDFQGDLIALDGLRQLEPDAAAFLALYKGALSLSGLVAIDDDSAKALARHKGELYLNGLATLPASTAQALNGYSGDALCLAGLGTLTEESALPLVTANSLALILDGLPRLTPAVGRALAKYEGFYLSLGGLQTLDVHTAQCLAESKALRLLLNGLADLPAEAASKLAAFQRLELHLNGLTSLSTETARALATCKVEALHLEGLSDISPEVAVVLARSHSWTGRLPGVTALLGEDGLLVARELSGREGAVSLPHLKKVSAEAWATLSAKPDIAIPPRDSITIVPVMP